MNWGGGDEGRGPGGGMRRRGKLRWALKGKHEAIATPACKRKRPYRLTYSTL